MSVLSEAAAIGGVKRLAIVDDAYDPPSGAEISEDAFNKFVQAVEGDHQLRDALKLHIELQDEDLNDWETFVADKGNVAALWEIHLSKLQGLTDPQNKVVSDLFVDVHGDRISKLQQLAALEKLLEGAGGEVLRMASDAEPERVASADVVFLDLYLSSEVPPHPENGKPAKSVLDRARDRASRYLTAVRTVTENDVNKVSPAFILISSQGTPQIARNFRKHVEQTAARFRFVSKQAIERGQPHDLMAIADIFRTCSASALVEPLQKVWPKVVEDAQKWVNERLLEIDISDFGRLYLGSLQAEGQPIDAYVKELLAGALAERVTVAFSAHLPKSDRPSPFDSHPGSFFEPPTDAFVELFSATRLTQDAGYRGPDGKDPISGDLYLVGTLPKGRATSMLDRKVLSVMSPICDLVSRPDKTPAANSVLLLEGVLKEASYHTDTENLLSVREAFYAVDWEWKEPQAIETKTLKKDVKDKKKVWLGRLKGEHFLALQSDYLSRIGRIGLPKSPNMFKVLAGKICYRHNGEVVDVFSFGAKDRFAYAEPGKVESKSKYFFAGMFMEKLAATLTDLKDGDVGSVKIKSEGLMARMQHVLQLGTSRLVGSHQIQGYLRMDVLTDRKAVPPASDDGTVLICVWKP